MEEFKNKEYYDKLNDKDKRRFHKLYLKYRNDEEKVIRIMNYEKKIEIVGELCLLLVVYVIYSVQKNAVEFYFRGGLSSLESFLLFPMAIPTGMSLYKYLYIAKEMNKKVSIAISIVTGYILGEIYVSIFEILFNYLIVNFMLEWK